VLTNAFDATLEWGHVRLTAEPGETGGVQVIVRDSGHGISPEALPKVFDPYFTTKETGTGIGLPLVKRIAQLHGGDVFVASTEGVGTTVTLLLPSAEEA
jgi:two-component system, NtrC family, sensor histidine kinase HydH